MPIPSIPAGGAIPSAVRKAMEAMRQEFYLLQKQVNEGEAKITSLQELLKNAFVQQSVAGSGAVLEAVGNYRVETFPRYIAVYTLLPLPAGYTLELWRGLGGQDSTSAQIVQSTVRAALEDHPPAGETYRYWLRYRRDGSVGPFTPSQGIELRTSALVNPEAEFDFGSGGLFLETFEAGDFATVWEKLDGGPATLTYTNNGVVGGKALSIAGAEEWRAHTTRLTFNPDFLYRMKIGLRLTGPPGNGPTNTRARLRAGFLMLDATGNRLDTAGGSTYQQSHFFVAFDRDLGAVPVPEYQEFTGYLRGFGLVPTNNATDIAFPSVARNGARYLRPTFVVNHDDGTGTVELDYIRIEAINPIDTSVTGFFTAVPSSAAVAMVGTTISKSPSAAAGWDAGISSLENYPIGAYVSFRADQTDKAFMIGFNSDPLLDGSFTSIDYAWYATQGGEAAIYESGVAIGTFGTYNRQTVFSLQYDGNRVRYFKDGTLFRQVALTGARLHLDSSFFDPGATAKSVVFGPFGQGFTREDGSYFESWEHQRWELYYNERLGQSPVVTYPLAGETGGRVLQVAGASLWLSLKDNIDFDPGSLYRIIGKLRRTAASTFGPVTEYAYFGVDAIAADGVTILDTNGGNSATNSHFVISQYDMATVPVGNWVTLTGYFKGTGSPFNNSLNQDTPTPLITGSRYFRPMLLVNWVSGNGTAQVDFIRIERMVAGRWQDVSGTGRPDDFATKTSSDNLVTNGNGEFGDNRNWTGTLTIFGPNAPFVWNGAGGSSDGGPFLRLSERPASVYCPDQRVLVQPEDREYEMFGAARSANAFNPIYLGLAMLDDEGYLISFGRAFHFRVPGGAASYYGSLHAAAVVGQNYIDLSFTNIDGEITADWTQVNANANLTMHFGVSQNGVDSAPTRVADYLSIGSLTRTNFGAFVRYTFSPGLTIQKAFPAGTRVAVSYESSTFDYGLFANEVLSPNWTRRSAVYRGINFQNEPPDGWRWAGVQYRLFRRGTVYVVPVLLHNWDQGGIATTDLDEIGLFDRGTAFKRDLLPYTSPQFTKVTPDPSMDFSDFQNFWIISQGSRNDGGGAAASVTHSVSGGMEGGRFNFVFSCPSSVGGARVGLTTNRSDQLIEGYGNGTGRRPSKAVRAIRGQRITVSVRWRRNSAAVVASSGQANMELVVRFANKAGGSPTSTQVVVINLNAGSTGAWQEDTGSMTVGTVGSSNYVDAYLAFYDDGTFHLESGDVDIDYFNVEIGAA
jgi:hypothetical protein